MRFLKLFILGTLFLGTSHASILLEPLGSLKIGRSSQGPTTGSVLGLGIGARMGLGILNNVIFIAADGRYGLSSFKASGGSDATSLSHLQLGVIGGVAIPASSFRVWFGYNFIDQLSGDVDQLGTPVDSTYTGSAFRIGGSYEINPVFTLNADIEIQKYDELEQNGTSVELNPTLSAVVLVLSLSMPLGL